MYSSASSIRLNPRAVIASCERRASAIPSARRFHMQRNQFPVGLLLASAGNEKHASGVVAPYAPKPEVIRSSARPSASSLPMPTRRIQSLARNRRSIEKERPVRPVNKNARPPPCATQYCQDPTLGLQPRRSRHLRSNCVVPIFALPSSPTKVGVCGRFRPNRHTLARAGPLLSPDQSSEISEPVHLRHRRNGYEHVAQRRHR